MGLDWGDYLSAAFWKRYGKGGKWELRPFAFYVIFAHVMWAQGMFCLLSGQICFKHFLFVLALGWISAFGVVAGAHRLWAHRAYKATLPLRILFAIMHTISGLGSVFQWARCHRLHHKYSETDADPHNSHRGLFFSHIGWILLKEHPAVTEKEKNIDLSDLHKDPVVAFQHKYHIMFEFILCQMLPVVIPYCLWDVSLYTCVCFNYVRITTSFNTSMLGNSVAHTWIRKPFDKRIGPADTTWLSLLIFGEGWHNFHHVFPWDYRSTDIGLHLYNSPRLFIELMAKIGWAYDLKTVPDHVIRKRAARTGDGSYPSSTTLGCINKELEGIDVCDSNCNEWKSRQKIQKEAAFLNSENLVSIDKLDVGEIEPGHWGWGDSDIPSEDIQDTVVINGKKGK